MTNKNSTYKRLGDYIREINVRNKDLSVSKLMGINIDKYFMPSVANVIGTDMSNYKVVANGQFACNLMHVGRDEKIPVALNTEDPIIVSPAYFVFEVCDDSLLPEYLELSLRNPEFDRNAWFHTDGDVRGGMDKEGMKDLLIPVPSLEEQRRIVGRYKAIETRIANNKQTIAKLEEAAQALYRKMFVDDVDVENLPDGWRMGTIEEISEKIVAGTIPKYDDTSSYMVLGQKCNKNGILDLNLCKRHIPKDNCLFLQKKDILVNSTGDGTLGRVGQIWFEPEKLAFDSNMTLVRPLNRYSEYLGCVLLNKQDYFVQISQGSTNQTRLYCSMIKPVPLIIPSDIILYDFSKAIKPMKEHVYLLYKENEKLIKMLSLMA